MKEIRGGGPRAVHVDTVIEPFTGKILSVESETHFQHGFSTREPIIRVNKFKKLLIILLFKNVQLIRIKKG